MTIPTVFPANQKQSFKYVRDRPLFYAHSTQEVLFFFSGVPPVVHADGENHELAILHLRCRMFRMFLSLETFCFGNFLVILNQLASVTVTGCAFFSPV